MTAVTRTTRPRVRRTSVVPVPATPTPAASAPVVHLTTAQIITIEELGILKRHQSTLRKRDEELSLEIKGLLRGSSGGVDEDGVLLASVGSRAGRRVVDYTRLAREFPEAYAACVTDSEPSEVLTLHNR